MFPHPSIWIGLHDGLLKLAWRWLSQRGLGRKPAINMLGWPTMIGGGYIVLMADHLRPENDVFGELVELIVDNKSGPKKSLTCNIMMMETLGEFFM